MTLNVMLHGNVPNGNKLKENVKLNR